ncbi:MAG TPA: cache domain-containing protein [Ramlibacter sp.]|jgi:signal transduction histidine kinase|nr:cache domain-containing protein [Ramlibacter sp.]
MKIAAAMLLGAASLVSNAAERATAPEAEAMVKKAITQIKVNRDKIITEVSTPKGPFHDRDLYLVVFKMDGTVLAHGFNQKMIGKNLMDMRDIDGREWVRERMDALKTRSSLWQDAKLVDPVTRKIEVKAVYCEKAPGDLLVCGGVYKL